MTRDQHDDPDLDIMDDGGDDDGPADGVDPIRGRPASFGLAIAGFVAILAAQFLPWQVIDFPSTVEDDPEVANLRERTLGEFGDLAMPYQLSVAVLLALVALALAIRPAHTRAAAAAAVGWAAGHLALLVGAMATLGEVEFNIPNVTLDVGTGVGVYAALASVALLGGAAGLLAVHPRPSYRPALSRFDDDEFDDDEAIDLTVSSAPPMTVTPLQPGDGR